MNIKDFTSRFLHDMMVDNLAEAQNITSAEVKKMVSGLSFAEYHKLSEAETIIPPSGKPIGPTGPSQGSSGGTNAKATWTGTGPISVGMTVGLKGDNGVPMPGEVSQVDLGAKGVKVKNPTTGQDEWMNLDMVQPYMVSGDNAEQNTQTQPAAEDVSGLTRLRELAGIKENCSAGATGAGSIAVAPAAIGSTKKRQYPEESLDTEYTPRAPAKTIIGDTKPNQASGKLSADLAASGKKSAGRINNGRKRR